MAALLQMGHDTQNLVGEIGLESFNAIVLSPLNRDKSSLMKDIDDFRGKSNKEIIFNPQLYYPHTVKSKIQTHPYFPNDFDSADYSNVNWWKSVHQDIHNYIETLRINKVIAPTIDPKVLSESYYSFNIKNTNNFVEERKENIESIWAVLIVNVNELMEENKIPWLVSLSTQFNTEGIYLVLKIDLEPRREISDSLILTNILKFIKEISTIGKEITLSFASSDMLLYKAAGIHNCGTSKFFNLRRFTPSRYNDNSGGRGQLPYLFCPSLMAFIRETDILRLIDKGYDELLEIGNEDNHWYKKIIEIIRNHKGDAWLGNSWRQYLSWFAPRENQINSLDSVSNILIDAEKNWQFLEKNNFLMEEPRNNGEWIRPWRIALSELSN